MKRYVLLTFLFIFMLAGCGTSSQNGDIDQTTITAYILELGNRVLVNQHITADELTTKTEKEIYDEYYLSSIYVNVDSVDDSIVSKLEVGQKVNVIVGAIAESAPAQAKASKIEIVDE
ncbi:DUF3221 domain-containing protein [Bacillus sinesaloumensis]|uniref:DUF3221 domain-containing protein n=1 Tax=Litchfieldia sinesaloumensis TaxID=1926280 RepID=UPI000988405A|nr:DUF3221 domain-containing protein [Bacillus sinesaloumensis]